MKQIAAAKFKEQCLALIDQVDREGIVITKRGKPVAKLIPFGADSAGLIGSLEDRLQIKGELLSTGLDWNADAPAAARSHPHLREQDRPRRRAR